MLSDEALVIYNNVVKEFDLSSEFKKVPKSFWDLKNNTYYTDIKKNIFFEKRDDGFYFKIKTENDKYIVPEDTKAKFKEQMKQAVKEQFLENENYYQGLARIDKENAFFDDFFERARKNDERLLSTPDSDLDEIDLVMKNELLNKSKKTKVKSKLKKTVDKITEKAKEEPLIAKSMVNKVVGGVLDVKYAKINRVAFWGGTKVPLKRASLEHRLRVGKEVSLYKDKEGDSIPAQRYNCQCTVYYKEVK